MAKEENTKISLKRKLYEDEETEDKSAFFGQNSFALSQQTTPDLFS